MSEKQTVIITMVSQRNQSVTLCWSDSINNKTLRMDYAVLFLAFTLHLTKFLNLEDTKR